MEFFKYTGLGKDFILIDNTRGNVEMNKDLAKDMCNRYFGIGADGVVLVSPSENQDIRMDIFNSDGSIAEMCGNASRCFAKFVYEKDLVKKRDFTIETLAGVIKLSLNIEDKFVKSIKVHMGQPRFSSKDIPFSIERERIVDYPIAIDGKKFKITSMFMGVPHTVIFIDHIFDDYILNVGKKLETSNYFPKKTNVNFVSILNRREIVLRTWERGAGYTLACGTGSCASVVAGVINGKLDRKVLVHLRGGDLSIEYDGEDVYMTGEALEVFRGIYPKIKS